MSDDQSYIVKAPDPAAILRNPTPDLVSAFLEQPREMIVESLTGFLASDMKGGRASAARIAQAALKGELFQQFAREINEFRAAGKIPDNFAADDRGYQTWVELMTVIDNECPDAERMEAMKAMFFEVNRVNATDAEKILAYQLFQISKRLTSGELFLLRAIYREYRKGGFPGNPSDLQPHAVWAGRIRGSLGHDIISLIEHHEKGLVDNNLITGRPANNPYSVTPADARLTDLGVRFCLRIEQYVAAKDPAKGTSTT